MRPVDMDIGGDMGACDEASDGLFNLQAGCMRDVFNREVRDDR